MSSKEKQSEKLIESIRKSKAESSVKKNARTTAKDRNKPKSGNMRAGKKQVKSGKNYMSGRRVWPD